MTQLEVEGLYDRVRLGMSEADVAGILGPPGMRHSDERFRCVWGIDYPTIGPERTDRDSGRLTKTWEIDDLRVSVTFDRAGGNAVHKALWHPGPDGSRNRHEP